MCTATNLILGVFLIIINVLLMILDVIVIIVGIAVTVIFTYLLAFNLNVMFSGGVTYIVVGVIIYVIVVLGCCAAITKSMPWLIAYAVCVGLVLITSLTLCIIEGVHLKDYEGHLEKGLMKEFEKFKGKSEYTIWDAIQLSMECCGVSGPGNWDGNIPQSCCSQSQSDNTMLSQECEAKNPQTEYVYKDGCARIVKTFYKVFMRVKFFLALGLTIIFVVAFVLTAVMIFLAVYSRESEEDT